MEETKSEDKKGNEKPNKFIFAGKDWESDFKEIPVLSPAQRIEPNDEKDAVARITFADKEARDTAYKLFYNTLRHGQSHNEVTQAVRKDNNNENALLIDNTLLYVAILELRNERFSEQPKRTSSAPAA